MKDKQKLPKETSQFHCFKCGRVWKIDRDDGKIVYSDGICGDCTHIRIDLS